jgi:glyceraldehyde 3-phosphate dehydrogenase
LISAPGKDVDRTVVYGVNEWSLKKDDLIVSNASCTTNCLATILKVLNDNFVVNKGTMTTIHSYTGDQSMVDTYHKDLYRARAGAMSMIPTTTGAANAIGDVIPDLKGKMNGFAMRVPTPNVSFVDLVCELHRDVSVEDIIDIMEKESQRRLKETLGFNSEKLVSIDFNHSPFSAVFDANQIYKVDNLYKITAWYDNEWGFSNRMLNVAKLMGSKED